MEFKTTAEYFYKMNMKFNWILAAPLGIAILLFLEWRTRDEWNSILTGITAEVILYVFMAITLSILVYSFLRYRRELKEINPSNRLRDKIIAFAPIYFRAQTLYSVAGGIALVGLFLTGSNALIVAYLLILFFQSIHRPAGAAISKSLRLSREERTILVRKAPLENEN